MNKKTALTFLFIGTMLFGLGSPVLKLLTSRGGSLGLEHPGAISFCNVLFVGNLCAGLLTLVFYGAIPLLKELAGLSRSTKGYLLLAAILSTIYPALLLHRAREHDRHQYRAALPIQRDRTHCSRVPCFRDQDQPF